MTSKTILVVDDEAHVRELLRIYLEREGFRVVLATDGEEAMASMRDDEPDLVLLDIMLPKMDGWEVCRRIRETHQTPIIMLTAKETDLDKITGLELGADDYVTKPFSPGVLVARVRAIFRRLRQLGLEKDTRVTHRELTIDQSQRTASLAGEPIHLSPREFDLLWFFANHPGQAFSREQLLQQVWGYEFTGDTRTVDAHIKRLRQKLEPDTEGQYIQTVWGVGYRFEERAAR